MKFKAAVIVVKFILKLIPIKKYNVSGKYGTTSNFARHMKTKHELIYEEWLTKKNVNKILMT
jgi:hypothetical protein